MELMEELARKCEELETATKKLVKNGIKFAETERDYKIKLRQEALKLREDKKMPVTLIAQIIYGVPEVAQLRFERDVAETMYQANLEYVNSTKVQIRILEGQINREWHSNG